MKKFLSLALMLISVASLAAETKVGMPKTIEFLMSPAGPVARAEIDFIDLRNFEITGPCIQDIYKTEYRGPSIRFSIDSYDYDLADAGILLMSKLPCENPKSISIQDLKLVALRFTNSRFSNYRLSLRIYPHERIVLMVGHAGPHIPGDSHDTYTGQFVDTF